LDFINVLMSDEPVMKSHISYYQRLLAGDQDEAAEIVEEHLKTHQVEKIYDEVMVPTLNYAKRDRALGRLAENDQQFIFQATREILEDLNGLNPEPSNPAAMIKKAPTTPRVRILGCPARDDADELALLMFGHLLDPARYELMRLPDETLASEVIDQIVEKGPSLVCISSLPPGGLAQTRYLCKRLRNRFPDLKIIVGRWGTRSENNWSSLLAAGADKVGTTLVETRDQVIQLSQISSPDATDNSLQSAGSNLR
jgi:methanogenic corrinoid protein MtbC1